MGKTVLGLALSHSPLLALSADRWAARALEDRSGKVKLVNSDGIAISYEELEGEEQGSFGDRANLSTWENCAAVCESALDDLAQALSRYQPDIVIIVGDDQGELFESSEIPEIAVFSGKRLLTNDGLSGDDVPEWLKMVAPLYAMDRVRSYLGEPDVANSIANGLVEAGIEVGVVTSIPDPHKAGIGHAFGFVIERLMGDLDVPVVPVFLNTFFPPNVPSADRALKIGEVLRNSVDNLQRDLRVAIVASGGLSHFVVNEEIDRRVLSAIERNCPDELSDLTPQSLSSGTSEILNWIVVASALRDLQVQRCTYVPVYRTPAGTGCGMGFVRWE